MTSRAKTATGEKARHYALFCAADEPLKLEVVGAIDIGHVRNARSGAQVGASQTTAIVTPFAGTPVRAYDVVLAATLTGARCARLALPVRLRRDDFRNVAAAVTATAWQHAVSALKKQVRADLT